MTLSRDDRQTLRDAGFTVYEIAQFHNAVTPDGKRQPRQDIYSPLWQTVINKRKLRVQRIAERYEQINKKTITRRELDKILNLWYTQHKYADPFDWLKREYRRVKHITGTTVAKATRRLQNFPGARKYIKTFFD